MTVVSSLTRR